MKKIVVEYTARFRSTIEVLENATQQDIADAMCEIWIPEDDRSKYITDTFEPVTDDNGDIAYTDFNYTADLHRQMEETGRDM